MDEQGSRIEEQGNGLEQAVRDGVDAVIPVVEALGAVIVLTGVVLAMALFLASAVRLRPASFERIRLVLGRHLALGLEFQLGSDILSTAISPSFEDLGKLAAIATIRTVLNFFLQRELREEAAQVEAERTVMR